MLRILANALLRQAAKEQNPRQYLDDILASKVTTASGQGGVIVSTTVNGKSVTFQAVPGTTIADFMAASLMALEALECGLSRVPSSTWGVTR
jgi:hypothetical protein